MKKNSVKQVLAVLDVLQTSAANGNVEKVAWALNQPSLYKFYAGQDQLLTYELCSAACVAVENGHMNVVEVLLQHCPKFSLDLFAECIGEMERQLKKRTQSQSNPKELGAWMLRHVNLLSLYATFAYKEDCETLAKQSRLETQPGRHMN